MGPRCTSRTSGQAISVRVRHCRLQLAHHRPGTRHLAELRSTLDLAPWGSSTVVRAGTGPARGGWHRGAVDDRRVRPSGAADTKALRRYDKVGLLPPTAVDSESGYRFYDPEQLAHAWLIAQLRRIGMPLAEIRTVCDLRPDAAARAVSTYWQQATADTATRAHHVARLIEHLSRPPLPETRYLLCSDGLSAVVSRGDLHTALAEAGEPEPTAQRPARPAPVAQRRGGAQ